ncbi:hypothetical protein BP00DRAFT_258283 [Aspergillus indologenus CBS 114.80]|uniref:Uncharacterized protein n=1 Tax=Aspergillus indologenus CBS 114.80 TaxID=1450541 RepID=A0A2V5I2P7_9EURO|nr:hypothetical protein BP00DRAFT_258283 [Aspergillus indologenus CBS 114.80]
MRLLFYDDRWGCWMGQAGPLATFIATQQRAEWRGRGGERSPCVGPVAGLRSTLLATMRCSALLCFALFFFPSFELGCTGVTDWLESTTNGPCTGHR